MVKESIRTSPPIIEIEGEPIEILLTEQEIDRRIIELGDEIHKDYKDQDLTLITILKGANTFGVELLRDLGTGNRETGRSMRLVETGFLGKGSYGNGTESSGKVSETLSLDTDITGKNVLIVEDIIDTGRTILDVLSLLKEKNPKSLEVVALLDKPERRVANYDHAKYTGFIIPNRFVVGRGLDYQQKYRNLRFIGVLINFEQPRPLVHPPLS
jgi:hypoxanthine phosphoribosyltransferase